MASCTQTNTSGTTTTAQGTTASTTTSGTTGSQTTGETTSGELPVIDYMIHFEPGIDLTNDTMAIKYWGEKVGVTFNIISPPRDNYQDKVSIALASGDLPDMIHFFKDTTSDKKYGPKIFVPLDTAMAEGKLPNLQKWFDKYPVAVDIMTGSDDHIYGFPQFNDYTWPGNTIWCRGDLLEKGGMQASDVQTIEDLKQAVKIIQENSGHDYIIFNRNGLANLFSLSMPYFGITQDVYFDDDPGGTNQFVFSAETPQFKVYVEFMKYCYDNKILHPDFATMTDNELDAAYSRGDIAFAFDNPNGWTDYDGRMMDILPTDAYAAAILPPEIDGKRYAVRMSSPLNIGWRWPVVISNKSDVIEDCLRAMDFAYSDEGRYNLLYGPQGDWWDFDTTYPGGVKFNLDVAYEQKIMFPQAEAAVKNDGKAFEDVFPEGSTEILNYGFGWYLSGVINAQDRMGMINYLPGMEDIAEMVPNAVAFYEDNNAVKDIEPVVVFEGDASDEVVDLRTAIQTYIQENVLLFINGQKPMSEYDAFVAGVKAFGSERLVELYNEAYNARYN